MHSSHWMKLESLKGQSVEIIYFLIYYNETIYTLMSFIMVSLCITLCTRGAYNAPYSFLLISNKFCNGGERPEQGD